MLPRTSMLVVAAERAESSLNMRLLDSEPTLGFIFNQLSGKPIATLTTLKCQNGGAAGLGQAFNERLNCRNRFTFSAETRRRSFPRRRVSTNACNDTAATSRYCFQNMVKPAVMHPGIWRIYKHQVALLKTRGDSQGICHSNMSTH